MRSFPNMRKLRIYNRDISSDLNNLRELHLYLVDKVDSVGIIFDQKYDLSIVESLINNWPLVNTNYLSETAPNVIPLGSFNGNADQFEE